MNIYRAEGNDLRDARHEPGLEAVHNQPIDQAVRPAARVAHGQQSTREASA